MRPKLTVIVGNGPDPHDNRRNEDHWQCQEADRRRNEDWQRQEAGRRRTAERVARIQASLAKARAECPAHEFGRNRICRLCGAMWEQLVLPVVSEPEGRDPVMPAESGN